MAKIVRRLLAAFTALTLGMALAACGSSDENSSGTPTTVAKAIDYEAIGLWNDGPCDTAKPALKLGLMTVFESPVVSLKDQADALEAAAKAFNARGGANGACIEVKACDDGANINQAIACVRELDEAGVVATVNDQGTAGPGEVSAAMAKAKIPRVANNVFSQDWDDPNAYPLDPSGTGGTFMHPAALAKVGAKKIGLIRVDLAQASALVGLLKQTYEDDGLTFPFDTPVAGGTTDYGQFVLAAQRAGVDGVTLNLGEQEASQVLNAGQQLGSQLKFGSGLGTFSHKTVSDMGDFAGQMVFDNAFAPATANLPVYDALRADLAASGEEALQTENMRTSPMRSWIGLYALLWMIRDSKMTNFTRDGITEMLRSAKDVPMLDMFGGEDWTPDTNHPGLYKRAGMNHYAVYRFDPEAPAPNGLEGNFVETGVMSFDEVLCDSPFGGPCGAK